VVYIEDYTLKYFDSLYLYELENEILNQFVQLELICQSQIYDGLLEHILGDKFVFDFMV
jgi:hypothetical protein